MTLHEYLKDLDKASIEALAARCKTSVGQLKQVAYGFRRASPVLAIDLDRETQGTVPCETLRPDIDWAYLREKRHQHESHAADRRAQLTPNGRRGRRATDPTDAEIQALRECAEQAKAVADRLAG